MTPLERARAAGYELGPEVPRGGPQNETARYWHDSRDGGREMGIAVSYMFIRGEAPKVRCWGAATDLRHMEEAIPLADLPTLRLRAEEWLGVWADARPCADCEQHVTELINRIEALQGAEDEGPGVAVLEDALRKTEAEVERMRAGCRRIANSTENRMTYSGEEARQIAARVVVGIRSLLTPTPEAPDER